MVRRTLLLLALALVAGGAHARTDAHEPPAAIARVAHDYAAARARQLGGEAKVDVGAIESQPLPRCSRALAAEAAPATQASGQWSIGVRCRGDRPWLVYVPVRVQVMAEALVADHALARGIALAEPDIARRRVDLATLGHGILTDPAQALGKRLRFPVAAGTVLNSAMLEQLPVVKRGQTVTVVSGQPGFEVRVNGEALADGTAGATIPVRNRVTRRVVEGRVERAGLVRIPL
jgi:flagella basal body P-ring formation protein FlgA